MKNENQANSQDDLNDPIDITPLLATPEPEELPVDPMFVTPERPARAKDTEPPRIAPRGQSIITTINPVQQTLRRRICAAHIICKMNNR